MFACNYEEQVEVIPTKPKQKNNHEEEQIWQMSCHLSSSLDNFDGEDYFFVM